MKFKGTPNLYVRIANKRLHRATGKKGFSFNENGIYETDNETMIKVLTQHFEIENSAPSEKIKQFKCKQCGLEANNKGLLLAHIRKIHPKGDK